MEDVLASNEGKRQSLARSPKQAMSWTLDLVRALTYMHQSEPPVVHGEVCPANLLLSSAGVLKLTGFGGAVVLEQPSALIDECKPSGRAGPAHATSTDAIPSRSPR